MHQMDDSAFAASNQVTSRKTVLSYRTDPSAGQEDTYPQGALLNSKARSQITKDTNFERKQEGAMKLKEKSGKGHRINHSSHKNNRCLHCAGDHQPHDCPTRQQQATTTSNPASGTGIYQNTSQFLNTSPPHSSHPQQHSQQSQSTVGITTPTLPVTNPQFPQHFQHPPSAPVSQVNQQLNYQVRPPHFQQFTQSQVSPLQTPHHPLNPQILPSYFPQYPPSNSPSVGSNDSSILAALQKQWEKQERIDKEHFDMERQKEERKRMKEEREQKKEEQNRLEK